MIFAYLFYSSVALITLILSSRCLTFLINAICQGDLSLQVTEKLVVYSLVGD